MTPDLSCATARVEISARIDGECDAATLRAVDEHLAICEACRQHEAALRSVRRTLRLQVAGEVPDLTNAIVERLRSEAARRPQREAWATRIRVASIAAAAAALLVLGASLPFVEQPPDTAGASEIARHVRAAARSLAAYRASFEITERGWHPRVPERHFSAEIYYEAPENFNLAVRDLTSYPTRRWPRNNVDLVAGPSRWWIREPATCPAEALPGGCSAPARVEERTVVRRRPFDGITSLPTDIVVPLETIASSGEFDVLGHSEIVGRPAYRIALSFRQALPLVRALQAGGSWRAFDPLDRVELWIDSQTWFPLRFEVRSGRAQPALIVAATSFSEPGDIDDDVFAAPSGGIVTTERFRQRPFGGVGATFTPSFTAGLNPYRAGAIPSGKVVAYADGMTWLKVERLEAPGVPELTAEELRLGAGWAYYQPADESFKRRIDIFTPQGRIHLESNLPRSDLLRVAESTGVAGRRTPPRTTQRGVELQRVTLEAARSSEYVKTPSYLPPSYRFSTAVVLRFRNEESVAIYYRAPEAEYQSFGVRLTQEPGIQMLPPSSEEWVEVAIDGVRGRWSAARGEIEWIDHQTYRAVAAPSFDLATTLKIARTLR
ncbi:MAG: zf-HC2 domain-containing protein [Actinomycetota bacterium]